VDLFTTIGTVKRAEIQYEPSGRSKGSGVVEFEGIDSAETAISKFTGYQYGGRPLGLSYVRYTNQSNGDGGMDHDATGGLTQDQIM
jgi:RNA recognition motif-containing protein